MGPSRPSASCSSAGFIGEIKRSDTGFTAELRGAAKAFDEERGRIYGRSCAGRSRRRPLRRRIDARGREGRGHGCRLSLTAPALASFPDAHFTAGRLSFISGGNLGFACEVKRHAARDGLVVLQLWQAAPGGDPARGRLHRDARLRQELRRCRRKFGNGLNFRGFPHIPGNDFIIGGVRPGDGALDGGSLFR